MANGTRAPGSPDYYQDQYRTRQKVSRTLQKRDKTSRNPFNLPLFNKSLARIAFTLAKLSEIIGGQPPDLTSGGGRGAKWLRHAIERKAAEGRVPQSDTTYYRLPEPVVEIGYNPAPHSLFNAAREIEGQLSVIGMAIRTLGTRRHLEASQIIRHQASSDMLIAVPGDFVADHELVEIIGRKLNGTYLPPLIIENTGNQFDDYLASLQFLELRRRADEEEDQRAFVDFEKLAESYGIYITHDRNATIALAAELHDLQIKEGLQKHRPITLSPFVPKNPVIFVGTETRRKYRELRAIYEAQGLQGNILPIDLLVDSYISVTEDKFSYEGNAAKKVHAALAAWNSMRPEAKVERLKSLGHKLYEMGRREEDTPLREEEILILCEDSGFSFKQTNPENGFNLSTEMEFARIAHQIHPRAEFPGTETGPVIHGSNGVLNFFKIVGQILTRYAEHGIPTTRALLKRSIIALTQLRSADDTYEAHARDAGQQIIMYGACTNGRFLHTPRPAAGPYEIDNFLVPEGDNFTEAELGIEWVKTASPRAQACRALVFDQGMSGQRYNDLPALKEKDFNIGIFVDPSHPAATTTIPTLSDSNRTNEFQVNQHGLQIEKLSDVQTMMLEGSDALILAFDPERAKTDFWRNLWIFSSLVVGEQTRDKYKLGKPLYLVNPKDDHQCGPFDTLEDLTADLHMLGTIKENPDILYRSKSSCEEAVEAARRERETGEYLRYDPPAYSKGSPIKPKGEKAHQDFTVAIFISATNESTTIRGIAGKLTAQLSEKEFAVFSGAGLHSGMGVITETIEKIREDFDAHHTGYSVPHIMAAGETGDKSIVKLLDCFHLCRDIYERIEGLLTADGSIVAPGGMGTVQELAGFALMKEMALRAPEGSPLKEFLSKEIVILNATIEVDGKRRGFYDVLIEIMPAEDLKRLGIHIAQTEDEAVSIMERLRENKRTLNATPTVANRDIHSQSARIAHTP